MIKTKKYIFGERFFEEFKVGSMVSWKPLNKEKQYGIIAKTFVSQIEDDERYVAFAKIMAAAGGSLDLMLSHLKLESEVKKCLSAPEKNSL